MMDSVTVPIFFGRDPLLKGEHSSRGDENAATSQKNQQHGHVPHYDPRHQQGADLLGQSGQSAFFRNSQKQQRTQRI
jgi:hypothetical protein